MKHERQRDRELGTNLGRNGPRSERRRQRRRLQVPAHQRRHQVGGAEGVKAPAEDGARDAVECGGVPGYLRAVDGEVWGYGPVATLGDEDCLGVGGFDGLGCCASEEGGDC